MPLKTRINYVRKGSSATAGNVNSAPQEIQANVEYLKKLIDAALLGQALFARDQTVASDVKVGMPVYWNSANQRLEKALAASTTSDQGTLVPAESAEVIGVCFEKSTTTKADILILGVAELDMVNAIDGDVESGRYYLSATEAGKLVRSRPAAAVPVLGVFGDKVIVYPATRDFLEDHIHYSFDLVCEPAGIASPPDSGQSHTITEADDSSPGWLPADHPSFDGKAPTGAVFGYNMAAAPELEAVWPPIPINAARVVWDKGENHVGATEVPLGSDGLVVIDRYGIWWMSNCYGDVPWPVTFVSSLSESQSEELRECPRTEQMKLRLDFVRMSFATDKTTVTSLTTDSELLEIVNCNGETAATGDLILRLLLEFLVEDSGELGSTVLKSFDAETQQFQAGKVTEGLLAGVGVTLSATVTRNQTPGDDTSPVVYQGLVTVNADSDPTGKEIAPALVRVDDMQQRFDGKVMYLSLMPDNATGLRARVDIPPAGLGSSPSVKIRVLLVGTEAGTLPALTLSYMRVPRVSEATALPSTDTAGTLTLSGTIGANEYIEIESAAIEVAAGDTLFYEIARAGDDGYDGEIGIIRQGAVLQ